MTWSTADINPITTPPALDHDIVYTLQASRPLPCIDCVTTLKTLVFRTPRSLQWFNAFNIHTKPFMNTSFALGCILTCLFVGMEYHTGRIVALVASMLQIVPLITGFLLMRIDIIKLLLQTYEFWYIMLNIWLSAFLLCIYVNDPARGVMPIVGPIGYVRALLIDANCIRFRTMTIGMLIGALAVVTFMFGVALKSIPATRTVVLVTINGHVLEGEDVALNGLGIILLLLCRNAYRKYTTEPHRRRTSDTKPVERVRLMAYRARMKFVECHTPPCPIDSAPRHTTTAIIAPVDSLPPASFPVEAKPDRQRWTQLLFITPVTLLHARHVVSTTVFDLLSAPWIAFPMQILSRAAVVLDVLAPIFSQHVELVIASHVTTSVYWTLSLALCHRTMLRLLLRSFDVQFLILEHAFAHITGAYILSWDKRCLPILTSGLWVSWLIVIDALTPIAKRKLQISRPLLALVFIKLLCQQVLTSYRFVLLPFDDRAIFSFQLSNKHGIVVKAIPFFLTRVLSMLWWTWHLLWRVYSQHPDELVVIQGAVEFDDYELHRKLHRHTNKGPNDHATPR